MLLRNPRPDGLIEAARSHVAVSANLTLVNLYWNVGRIITRDIQENEKRAGYGEQLIDRLAESLTRDYGQGYSSKNLWDMKRFSVAFEILQTVSGELGRLEERRTAHTKTHRDGINQTMSDQSVMSQICQPVSSKSPDERILQTVSGESSERIIIDFRKHFRLGWSHYRLLLSQSDPVRRRFYFEQAASQRWPVRELKRQIDRGLFERVALSKNTRQLVAQEKRKGPMDVARHEDVFKDPYVLDFLGLKGSYSEKDLESAISRHSLVRGGVQHQRRQTRAIQTNSGRRCRRQRGF